MKKNEKGQSLVEMALLLPVLLILLVGIFDLGRMLYTYSHLHMATQETVRLGGLGHTDTEIAEFARDYVHVKDPSLLEINITPDDSNRESGEYVTVELSYPFKFVTPIISDLFSSELTIETNSTIRVE